MDKVYKFLKQVLILLKNLPMFIQLVLIFTAMLLALYWFLDLAEINAMNFIQPFADRVVGFMHNFYHQETKVKGLSIDGSLLLFDLMLFVIIFVVGKVNIVLDFFINILNKLAKDTKEKSQVRLNKQLETDMFKEIMQYNSFAIEVEFSVQDIMVNNFWGGDKDAGVAERQAAVISSLINKLSPINSLRLSKTKNRILVLSNDFNNFDRAMLIILSALEQIKEHLKKERWLINWCVATVIYKQEDLNKICEDLDNIIALRLRGEIACYGNFNLRYSHIDPTLKKFNAERRGTYSIKGKGLSIWRLVKKI